MKKCTVFQCDCSNLHSPIFHENFFSYILIDASYFLIFDTSSSDLWGNIIVVLIIISLMISYIDQIVMYFFLCLLWENVCWGPLPFFGNWIIWGTFSVELCKLFYIFWILSPCVYIIYTYILPISRFLFVLFMVSLTVQDIFISM